MLSAPCASTTSVAGAVPESTSAIEWIGAVCSARPFRSRASSSWRSKVTAATATLGCMSVPWGIVGGGGAAAVGGDCFGGDCFGAAVLGRFLGAVRLGRRLFAGAEHAGHHFAQALQADGALADHAQRQGGRVDDGGGLGAVALDRAVAAFKVDLHRLRQLCFGFGGALRGGVAGAVGR